MPGDYVMAASWGVFCPTCQGHGRLSIKKLASICCEHVTTMRRLLLGKPMRARTLLRLMDKLAWTLP